MKQLTQPREIDYEELERAKAKARESENGMTKADFVELKSMKNPPQLLKDTLFCLVGLISGEAPSEWKEVQHFINDLTKLNKFKKTLFKGLVDNPTPE